MPLCLPFVLRPLLYAALEGGSERGTGDRCKLTFARLLQCFERDCGLRAQGIEIDGLCRLRLGGRWRPRRGEQASPAKT